MMMVYYVSYFYYMPTGIKSIVYYFTVTVTINYRSICHKCRVEFNNCAIVQINIDYAFIKYVFY